MRALTMPVLAVLLLTSLPSAAADPCAWQGPEACVEAAPTMVDLVVDFAEYVVQYAQGAPDRAAGLVQDLRDDVLGL